MSLRIGQCLFQSYGPQICVDLSDWSHRSACNQMYQEECGWQALLSGLVNHAAADDRCEDLYVADLVGVDRKDVIRKD